MATGRAGRLAVVLVALLAVTGCASEDTVMTPKSLRITYGGDQSTYERLMRETDCDKLIRIAEGRSRDYPRTGDRADLGVERAVRQQLRALDCDVPAS